MLKHDKSDQIDKTIEFRKLFEILLLRARGDPIEDVKKVSKSTLQHIVESYSNAIY